MWKKIQMSITLQTGQEKVKVKTTGLVHDIIILDNCCNHDQWSMSMSYDVHKVTPIQSKIMKYGQGQNNNSCVQLHHPS